MSEASASAFLVKAMTISPSGVHRVDPAGPAQSHGHHESGHLERWAWILQYHRNSRPPRNGTSKAQSVRFFYPFKTTSVILGIRHAIHVYRTMACSWGQSRFPRRRRPSHPRPSALPGSAFKYHVLNYPTNKLISLFLRQPDDCCSRMTPTIWDVLSRRIRHLYSNAWTPPSQRRQNPSHLDQITPSSPVKSFTENIFRFNPVNHVINKHGCNK